MTKTELLAALRRLKVQTGSLACLGCGYDHNCGIHGCAILRAAEAYIRGADRVVRPYEGEPEGCGLSRQGPTESSAPTKGNRGIFVGAGDPARPTGREGQAPKAERS